MAVRNVEATSHRMLLLVILASVATTTKGLREICPNETTFERSSGMKFPSSHFLFSELHMVPTRSNNDTWHYECNFLCTAASNCGGYFVDHYRQSCRLLPTFTPEVRTSLQPSKGSFFEKTCLKVPPSCRGRQWLFDRVVGMKLNLDKDKVLTNVTSKSDCQQACLDEVEFHCRSVEYYYDEDKCSLSRNDRRTMPNAFVVSTENVDYFENQCITVPHKCLLTRKPKTSFPYVLAKVSPVLTDASSEPSEVCLKHCISNSGFVCRAFIYDRTNNECLLSSDDSGSVHHSTFDTSPSHDYFERSDCLDVSMKCDGSTMTAIVTVGTPFRGRVYAMVNPNNCYYEPEEESHSSNSSSSSSSVTLSLPLKSPVCGTRNLGNGTFANSIIVQYHPNILRSTDRRIDVTCDYEEHKIRLKAGKQIVESSDMDNVTAVVTGIAPTPDVRLRIVDAAGNDVTGVDLGSDIFLRVDLLDGNVYGITGTDLIARSGDDAENITLIDSEGCPIETSVFPPLQTISGSKSLQAPFQAFRFTSDATVRFQITISFCINECHPAYCESEEMGNVTSYGRRRRSIGGGSARKSGDIVSDVVMEGALFVRARLERQEVSDHQRQESYNGELRGRRKWCTSTTVVVGMGVLAAIVQVVIVCAFTLVMCGNRKQSNLFDKSEVSTVTNPCLSRLVTTIRTTTQLNSMDYMRTCPVYNQPPPMTIQYNNSRQSICQAT